MLRMVSYPHRPQSGHITGYLNRTYHVLPTPPILLVDTSGDGEYDSLASNEQQILWHVGAPLEGSRRANHHGLQTRSALADLEGGPAYFRG
jgi:hypothetical protein